MTAEGLIQVQDRFSARCHDARMPFARLPAALFLLAIAQAGSAAEAVVGRSAPAQVAQRVLELVNKARSEGRRCGAESFPPTAPLASAAPLDAAAEAHARDMATRGYFAHRGKDGREPRDRVRSAGYAARLTGENIAMGPESAEEVVAGWLQSAGHCANLMDGRFRHMGIGVAAGSKPGQIYWVQTLGAPGGV